MGKSNRDRNIHSETDRLEIAGTTWNFAPFGLIFTSKKYLEAAKVVVLQEEQLTLTSNDRWHPVGKYLACHSIELSFKAFLTLKGERLRGAKAFGHNLSNLLAASERQTLQDMVVLTAEERDEIIKASPYYDEKVFEYPSLPEATRAYPEDPIVGYLLSAAHKLVDGLYTPS